MSFRSRTEKTINDSDCCENNNNLCLRGSKVKVLGAFLANDSDANVGPTQVLPAALEV